MNKYLIAKNSSIGAVFVFICTALLSVLYLTHGCKEKEIVCMVKYDEKNHKCWIKPIEYNNQNFCLIADYTKCLHKNQTALNTTRCFILENNDVKNINNDNLEFIQVEFIQDDFINFKYKRSLKSNDNKSCDGFSLVCVNSVAFFGMISSIVLLLFSILMCLFCMKRENEKFIK